MNTQIIGINPTQLPVVKLGKKNYYVDARLHELRNVEDFMDKITWDMVNSWDDFEYDKMCKKGWAVYLTVTLMPN